MSRAAENLVRKLEALDRRRIAAAAERIAADPDLRYLIRSALDAAGVLTNTGMGVNPFSNNALTTAHETGKMAAMQALIDILATDNPDFYPDLLKEHLREQSSRTADIARADNASGS